MQNEDWDFGPVSIDDYPEITAAVIFDPPGGHALRQLARYCDARLWEAIVITHRTGERVWASDVMMDIADMLCVSNDRLHELVDRGHALLEEDRRTSMTEEERQAEDAHLQWIDDNLDQLVEEFNEFDPTAREDFAQFWAERDAHHALRDQFNAIVQQGMA